MIRAALSLLVAWTLGMFVASLTASAQQPVRAWKIGVLQVGTAASGQHLFEALKQGLRDRGYVEGQQVIFERRVGENRSDLLAAAAAELVRMKVDLIVTSTDQGIAAVKRQTQTIPIVMANSSDPVGTGLVASLARPGGNITGNSAMSPDLAGKRLELLKEVVPGLSRVGILWNPDVRGAVLDYRETESAAALLHLQLHSIEVSRIEDLDSALAAVTTGRVQALIVPGVSPLLFANRSRVVDFAVKSRLPVIYGTREFADAGGLMAYGPNAADQWRRAADYVDKILKGARAAELPVERASRFELVINLRTAQAIGLPMPPSLLQRADHVIR